MQEGIFRVEINETGYNWVRRFHSLTLIILVFTFLVSGATMITGLFYVLKSGKSGVLMRSYRWRNLGYVCFVVFNFLLQVTQIIFYRRFASKCVTAIDGSNAILFNQSFRWLYLQSVCFLLQILVSMMYFVFSYFVYRF